MLAASRTTGPGQMGRRSSLTLEANATAAPVDSSVVLTVCGSDLRGEPLGSPDAPVAVQLRAASGGSLVTVNPSEESASRLARGAKLDSNGAPVVTLLLAGTKCRMAWFRSEGQAKATIVATSGPLERSISIDLVESVAKDAPDGG